MGGQVHGYTGWLGGNPIQTFAWPANANLHMTEARWRCQVEGKHSEHNHGKGTCGHGSLAKAGPQSPTHAQLLHGRDFDGSQVQTYFRPKTQLGHPLIAERGYMKTGYTD